MCLIVFDMLTIYSTCSFCTKRNPILPYGMWTASDTICIHDASCLKLSTHMDTIVFLHEGYAKVFPKLLKFVLSQIQYFFFFVQLEVDFLCCFCCNFIVETAGNSTPKTLKNFEWFPSGIWPTICQQNGVLEQCFWCHFDAIQGLKNDYDRLVFFCAGNRSVQYN